MDAAPVLRRLERAGTRRTVLGMARYGLEAKQVFGVPMGALLTLAKELGRDHALAAGLWASGWYEGRLLAALVDEPAKVTSRQMDAWAADFENWGDCDTVCFKLFDQSPLAWKKAPKWAGSPREFVKRGGFALMASLALHDKDAADDRFLPFLPLIERGARDDRNFVMKGANWALRSIGRRGLALNAAAIAAARRLAAAPETSCRWVGRTALRELTSPKLRAALVRRARETTR